MTNNNNRDHPDLGVFNRRPMQYMGIKWPWDHIRGNLALQTKSLPWWELCWFAYNRETKTVNYWIQTIDMIWYFPQNLEKRDKQRKLAVERSPLKKPKYKNWSYDPGIYFRENRAIKDSKMQKELQYKACNECHKEVSINKFQHEDTCDYCILKAKNGWTGNYLARKKSLKEKILGMTWLSSNPNP